MKNTDHSEAISSIEACDNVGELRSAMHRIAQDMGFAAFGFVDAGRIGRSEKPFYIGTGGKKWEDEYVRNGFAAVDPCLKRARRTNVPFTWRSTPLPERRGLRAPGALKTMWAARDHGFKDGLVVPFHFRDADGFFHSSSAVFFWKDPLDRFDLLLRERRHDLHTIMLYWIQRTLDVIARDERMTRSPFQAARIPEKVVLSDREKDVLGWAAQGLTVQETAEKLKLSADTIETHVRNAIRKLGANNKTHATVLAIHVGLIDL